MKTVRLVARCSEEVREEIRTAADVANTSMSELIIRGALREARRTLSEAHQQESEKPERALHA